MKTSSLFCLATLSIASFNSGCNSTPNANEPMLPSAAIGSTAGTIAQPASGGANAPKAGTSSATAGTAASPSSGNAAATGSSGTSSVATAGTGGMGAASAGQSGSTGTGPMEGKIRRAISADYVNQTLSVVNVDKLVEGATRADALIGTVDMSKYSPGPLYVAVTPDGKTALVSVTTSWLNAFDSSIPAGNGILVFVDLETLKVTSDLDTGPSPMGIVITNDGKHAFVGQLSNPYMAYVDIEKKTFTMISTGANTWNEELALDDTGTAGILSSGTAGDAITFSVMTPTTNGMTRGLTGDAGGVAFFPGTKFAYVIQAPTALTGKTGGYNVLDVTNPASPMVTDSKRTSGDPGQVYPVTAVANRKSVVYPSADENTKKLTLTEVALENGKAKVVQTLPLGDSGFSYGLAANAEGKVLVCSGGDHQIFVVDLTTGKSFSVPWGVTKLGPMDMKYIP